MLSLCIPSCGIIGPMLFDPSVRAAFINPAEVAPIDAIQTRPHEYSGKHIAVDGIATSVTQSVIILDGYLSIHHRGHPYFKNIKLGDRVAARGKFTARGIGREGPAIRFPTSDEFRNFQIGRPASSSVPPVT